MQNQDNSGGWVAPRSHTQIPEQDRVKRRGTRCWQWGWVHWLGPRDMQAEWAIQLVGAVSCLELAWSVLDWTLTAGAAARWHAATSLPGAGSTPWKTTRIINGLTLQWNLGKNGCQALHRLIKIKQIKTQTEHSQIRNYLVLKWWCYYNNESQLYFIFKTKLLVSHCTQVYPYFTNYIKLMTDKKSKSKTAKW